MAFVIILWLEAARAGEIAPNLRSAESPPLSPLESDWIQLVDTNTSLGNSAHSPLHILNGRYPQ